MKVIQSFSIFSNEDDVGLVRHVNFWANKATEERREARAAAMRTVHGWLLTDEEIPLDRKSLQDYKSLWSHERRMMRIRLCSEFLISFFFFFSSFLFLFFIFLSSLTTIFVVYCVVC